MKRVIWSALIVCLARASAAEIGGLPVGAFIVEKQALPGVARPNRALVLWMLHPEKHDRGPYSDDNIYTCPEYTRGSYYAGPTRVSLVDTQANRVINTVEIRDSDEDSFDVPYRIEQNKYYPIAGTLRQHEGKPSLLQLRDLNGDGRALETAFFEAEACMGLATELIGYSVKQDRVIVYPVTMTVLEAGKKETQAQTWVDYLFGEKPQRPGYWKYEIDYRGRGGSLDRYEVWYDAGAEKFTGTLVSTPGSFQDR